jgi:FdrA protein
MIDNDLRLRRLDQESMDEDVALILLDVVLGEGSHPDPAAELGPAIERARQRGVEVGVVLVGTDEDPQGLEGQRSRLEEAGARVFSNTMDLVAFAVALLGVPAKKVSPPVPNSVLTAPVVAINVGLESFYDSLVSQGASAIHVDWRPPAGGNERLMGILSRMKTAEDQDPLSKKG